MWNPLKSVSGFVLKKEINFILDNQKRRNNDLEGDIEGLKKLLEETLEKNEFLKEEINEFARREDKLRKDNQWYRDVTTRTHRIFNHAMRSLDRGPNDNDLKRLDEEIHDYEYSVDRDEVLSQQKLLREIRDAI